MLTFVKVDFIKALLGKVSNDNKTTILGVLAGALLVAQVNWTLLLKGDSTQIGYAAGALVTALLGYYTNKPEGKKLASLAVVGLGLWMLGGGVAAAQVTPPQPMCATGPCAQYPISDLYMTAVYPDRATYLKETGQQAPPFNAALPIKEWVGSGLVNVFDAQSPSTGYVVQINVPSSANAVNLPGVYTYPPTAPLQPTVAQEVSPYGVLGTVNPNTLCMQADAQSLAAALTPLYGKTVTVVDDSPTGYVGINYGTETRRQWGLVAGTTVVAAYAESLLIAENTPYQGEPGHWTLQGNTAAWVQDQPVTTPPANAVTIAPPMRALVPGEQIEQVVVTVPPPVWYVVRTDLTPAPPAPPPCTPAAAMLHGPTFPPDPWDGRVGGF